MRLVPIVLLAAVVHLAGRALSAQQPVGADNPAVDTIFARFARPDSPGCALGVYRDGRIAYTRGYGMADLERRVPITPTSVFDLGSTAKQFTAAAVVLLAQDGKLSLDDDVRRHIPELPAYARPITLRHLLHHTSGLRDYIGLLTLGGARLDGVTTPEDALAAIARQKSLNFLPGDEHLYSNSGYFLLSLVVERVARQPMRDFLRERIFTPLGMTRTHVLGSYDDIVPDRALAYSPRPGGGMRLDMPRWLQLGDGAVFSTVEELFRWDENFHAPAVGGRAMVDTLQSPGRLTSGRPITYALGLNVNDIRGLREVSHGGAWGGYRAELLRYPEHRFAVATLCNAGNADAGSLARRVAAVYLADAFAAAPAPPGFVRLGATPPAPASPAPVPAHVIAAITGTYRDTASRALRTVTADSGRLQFVTSRPYDLRPAGDPASLAFELVGPPVKVLFAPAVRGRAPGARMVQGTDTSFMERIELATPTAADLAAYAGTYDGAEVGASYRITVEGGALVVHRPAAPPSRLSPSTRDEFSFGPAIVRFSRDRRGAVTGFTLDVGRVRGLRFERRGR